MRSRRLSSRTNARRARASPTLNAFANPGTVAAPAGRDRFRTCVLTQPTISSSNGVAPLLEIALRFSASSVGPSAMRFEAPTRTRTSRPPPSVTTACGLALESGTEHATTGGPPTSTICVSTLSDGLILDSASSESRCVTSSGRWTPWIRPRSVIPTKRIPPRVFAKAHKVLAARSSRGSTRLNSTRGPSPLAVQRRTSDAESLTLAEHTVPAALVKGHNDRDGRSSSSRKAGVPSPGTPRHARSRPGRTLRLRRLLLLEPDLEGLRDMEDHRRAQARDRAGADVARGPARELAQVR